MSVTRNLESSALFSMPFLGYQPVNVSNGEPALSAANITKQTILGAPFKWPFNRDEGMHYEFDTDETTWGQDFTLELPNFGFLERAWLTNPEDDKKTEIEVKTSLAGDNTQKRPGSISSHTIEEDFVSFRLNAVPDAPYYVDGCFQRAPVLMTSLASTWSPLPDHLSYIYDWGFLGFVALLTQDSRAGVFLGKFTAHLLGAQEGLTALQRNIFLGNFLELMNQQGREQLATQQGAQARGNS